MKKLFIITDVGKTDSRYRMRDDMIGTVVRAELTSNFSDLFDVDKPPLLYVREDGTTVGYTIQDLSLWHQGKKPNYNVTFHACITVKPLQ